MADYLTFLQAKKFIDQCEENEISVWGLERYTYENGYDMADDIIDLSSLDGGEVGEAISASRNFLSLFGGLVNSICPL